MHQRDRQTPSRTDGRTDARRHRQRLCIASRKRCHIENGYWKPLIIIIIIITIITFAWRHAVVTLEALAAGQREKSLKCYIKQKLFEARREDCQREWERETVDNCLRQSSRCQVQINENYDEQNKKMVPIEAQWSTAFWRESGYVPTSVRCDELSMACCTKLPLQRRTSQKSDDYQVKRQTPSYC